MDIFLEILDWIVLVAAIILILAGLKFIRQEASVKTGVTYGVIFFNLCYLLATITVLVGNFSSFHLLWLFPASWFAGFLGLIPPFSYVVSSLGKIYGPIVALGVKGERGKPEDTAP